MMNQYYSMGGHGGRRDSDRAPYRRPVNRGIAGGCGMNPGGLIPPRAGTGCGCNAGRNSENRRNIPEHTPCRPDQRDVIPVGTSNRGRCGCNNGCDNGNGNGSTRLMDQIRAVDFALYETVLYLDVYPHSCDALETYRKLKAQSEALHAEYEASHAPLTAFGNKSDTSWDWMNKPFPWEYDAD